MPLGIFNAAHAMQYKRSSSMLLQLVTHDSINRPFQNEFLSSLILPKSILKDGILFP